MRTGLASVCALLLVVKEFVGLPDWALALERNASMQGVGTKVGTAGLGSSDTDPDPLPAHLSVESQKDAEPRRRRFSCWFVDGLYSQTEPQIPTMFHHSEETKYD
jgi:hypothetical protein